MNTIFELRDTKTGKLACQSTSLAHALREAKWRGAFVVKGRLTGFKISPISRDGWGGMIARSVRFVGIWPQTKVEEFAWRWFRGDKLRDLEKYFDASSTALDKRRSELGLPMRIPAGLWFHDDEEAINFMFDEGMTPDEIAQHFKRTKDSVVCRLRKSSLEFSDRRAKYTKSAPARYGKSKWPRKKEVLRKMDEARKLARGSKVDCENGGRFSPFQMANSEER